MASLRPRLAAPILGVDEYLQYYGAEEYYDFCRILGIVPMDYWRFVGITRDQGVEWWYKRLRLRDIKLWPPADDYRMMVRRAHPDEADGPTRLYRYAVARAREHRMTPETCREMLWNELGGRRDHTWYVGAVNHVNKAMEQYTERVLKS